MIIIYKTVFSFYPRFFLAKPLAPPVVLPMALIDVLLTATLGFTAGVVYILLSAEAIIAVVMIGVRLVTTASPVVTGVAAVDATFTLTSWYFCSYLIICNLSTHQFL